MSSLNPSETLYRETSCEHGYVGGHATTEWNELRRRDDLIGCDGGSREEVTIDYEAALSHLESDAGENVPIEWAITIVNAALGE